MAVITICGSYKFKKEMWERYKELTDQMHLVFLPAIDCKGMDKVNYKILHQAKIDMSDYIYVVDIDGYFGDDTYEEIRYAEMRHKEVVFDSVYKQVEKYCENDVALLRRVL